jgi:hypothetical protein
MSKVTRAGDERDATRDRGLAAWRLPHVVAFPTAIFTFNLHRPKLHWRKKGPVFHPASTIIASHPLLSRSSPHRLLCHRPLHSSTPVLPSSTSYSSPVKIQSPPSSRHITKKKPSTPPPPPTPDSPSHRPPAPAPASFLWGPLVYIKRSN